MEQPPDQTLLEEFMSLVAHEVRTPLMLIEMGVRTLTDLDGREGDHQETRAEVLELVKRNTELAILLMDRMRLARDVETGSVELDRQRLDLVELVRMSVSDLRFALADEHTIGFTCSQRVVLSADPTALREIMLNLISNAAKYSASGAPIEVTVDTDAGAAVVVVRNHGGGVTPGEDGRIFEKFFQGDNESPGVGLGLFVSRGLAQAHGGDLNVRPATDEGSEFVLRLPTG